MKGDSPEAGQEICGTHYEAETTLFTEGDDSQDLYVLLTGSVRVLKKGRVVATLDEPGAYFGEMSSLLGVPRTATVVTNEAAGLLVVPPRHIQDLFGQTPHLALKIARGLAARLARTTSELVGNCELP